MLPLESIEPPLFDDKGDRTVSRDAFDLPPSNNPIHESPTVARSEPRTTIGSLSLATTSASTSASLRRAGGAREDASARPAVLGAFPHGARRNRGSRQRPGTWGRRLPGEALRVLGAVSSRAIDPPPWSRAPARDSPGRRPRGD